MIKDSKAHCREGIVRDQIGKVFMALGQDLRQCLMCDGVFTRQAASKHSTMPCTLGIDMKTGRK